VTANGKRWRAEIYYDNKMHNLGCFGTKQEAALAYDRAAREHGGGKRKLNYESIEAAEKAAAEAKADHTLVHDMCADPKKPRAKPRQPSGFHGVYAKGKQWRAQITYGGKKHYLSTFDTKQEAAFAYDRAAREHGGGKTWLNYASMEAAEEAASQAQAEHILVHDMCVEPKHRQLLSFHGVTANGARWRADIYYDGKHHSLGTFDTKQEAALAYDTAAREHGGGQKKFNYESIEAAEEAAAEAQAEHILLHGACAAPKKPRPKPLRSSGFHGVYANGKRWRAHIKYDGKPHHIGCFVTKQEAALAYDRAAREHGGRKKKFNYESIEAAEEAAAEAQAEHTLVNDMCADPKKTGSSGVYADGKRWRARIYYGGKQHHIGSFVTKQKAALAYDTAAREHGAGKRKLNYESIEAAEEAAAEAQAEIFADALCAGPYQRRPRCSQQQQ
jgi:hypothetical protein